MAFTLELKGKNAVVTGASSGLGARFATVLAEAGANVVLAARRVDRLEKLAADLTKKGVKALPIEMDVTDVASIRAGIAKAEAAFGTLDILINNSGINVQRRIADYEEADFDAILDTNTKGAFFVAQAVVRHMLAKNIKGRIVNVASAAGIKPMKQLGVYAMSKSAVIMMTQCMAQEFLRAEINVNAIAPGYIETEINSDYWKTPGGQKLKELLPRKRVGDASDLDGLILLLCSEAGRFINGATITADDGMIVS
ncbi:MAG: glucose 1-dehydrogenase [Alphaproteobacteria bacterium]